MKAIIEVRKFNKLIDSVKRFTAKGSARPLHEWIRLEVEGDGIAAIATDGYKLGVETVSCIEAEDSFTAYIKPDIKKIANRYGEVSLELSENRLFVTYGDNVLGYDQPEGEFLDWKNVYLDLARKEPDYTIGFDADHLIAALKSAKASADRAGWAPVVLKFRGPLEPVILETGDGCFKIALPMRLKSGM